MQTLEQCYESISRENSKWSYYSNPPIIANVWHSEEDAYNFITNYFDFAGKTEVFGIRFFDQFVDHFKKRTRHTISVFLLGLKLAESFGIDIDTRNSGNMDFKYYWFLACLYHDIGYVYEKEREVDRLDKASQKGINATLEIFEVCHLHNRIFKTYPKNIIDFYFKCRANSNESEPVIDHGIIGGILLYDKLRKQYSNAWKHRTSNTDTRKSFYVKCNGTDRDLHLSNSHFNDYAKAADAILAHNIWKSKLQEYLTEYSHVYPLPIVDLSTKIGISNKICFVLSLADTLEPLKRDESFLNRIDIKAIPGIKGIVLQMDDNIFDVVYCDIKDLETWVNVTVNVDNMGGRKKSIEILAN